MVNDSPSMGANVEGVNRSDEAKAGDDAPASAANRNGTMNLVMVRMLRW
jgi:hypothetical protein